MSEAILVPCTISEPAVDPTRLLSLVADNETCNIEYTIDVKSYTISVMRGYVPSLQLVPKSVPKVLSDLSKIVTSPKYSVEKATMGWKLESVTLPTSGFSISVTSGSGASIIFPSTSDGSAIRIIFSPVMCGVTSNNTVSADYCIGGLFSSSPMYSGAVALHNPGNVVGVQQNAYSTSYHTFGYSSPMSIDPNNGLPMTSFKDVPFSTLGSFNDASGYYRFTDFLPILQASCSNTKPPSGPVVFNKTLPITIKCMINLSVDYYQLTA